MPKVIFFIALAGVAISLAQQLPVLQPGFSLQNNIASQSDIIFPNPSLFKNFKVPIETYDVLNFRQNLAWSSKLCADTSLAKSYLTQVRQLITNLEGNPVYEAVLKKRTNAIAYIKNSANEALLDSNCSQFFTGLKAARQLDIQSMKQQQQYETDAINQYKQILGSILQGDSKAFTDNEF